MSMCRAAVRALTLHPQCSGRSHHLMILERLISYMRSFDDVRFGTLSETYDCWTEDSAAQAPGQTPRAPGVP